MTCCIYRYCKDQIWLESKNGNGSRPTQPKQWIYRVQERKLVWSWPKILDFSVKRLKIRSWNAAISLFGQALEVWFFFFSFCSGPLFLLSFLALYTMAFFPFLSSTCGPGIQRPFSSSPLPSLKSSILSWKAVRSLFRYHLHINAARRLAGRHLMRRWQHL